MSEFGVTFKGLQAALDSDRVMADRLAAAADEVKTIRGQLTFEIRQRSSIDNAPAQADPAIQARRMRHGLTLR